LCDPGRHGVLVADIDPECRDRSRSAVGLKLGHRGLVVGDVGAPDRDGRTGLVQTPGHPEPDSAVAAGDQRHLPGEVMPLGRQLHS